MVMYVASIKVELNRRMDGPSPPSLFCVLALLYLLFCLCFKSDRSVICFSDWSLV